VAPLLVDEEAAADAFASVCLREDERVVRVAIVK
jgi:hypothetical protein